MHNFTLALNPTVSQLRTNVQILEQSANDDMYRVWIVPMDMENSGLPGTATYTAYGSNIPAHWTLPDAVTSGITVLLPRHPQWVNGKYYLTVLYSVDGTSAGDILWRIRQVAYSESTAFTAAAGNTVQKAAPTTANTLHKLDLTQSTSNNGYFDSLSQHIAHQFSLDRVGGNAADSNTDDVRVHAVIVNYLEARRTV